MSARVSRRRLFAASLAALIAAPARAAETPVVVSSKLDVEGGLIGTMILEVLKRARIPTVDRLRLGPTTILRRAILAGAIDIYPEYTGNAAFFFNRDGEAVWKNAAAGYALAAALDKARNDLVWLKPAPADNSWVIAVPDSVARSHGLTSLVDYARWAHEGGPKLAASAEFVESPAGLPAFESTYGFRLGAEALLILSGGETSATIKAAASHISGVNSAMAYATDGALAALHMLPLDDVRHAQPIYAPAAVVRGPVLRARPEIESLLAPVFAGLDLQTLQTLNARIAVDGQQTSRVAEDYLERIGRG